MSQPEVKCLFVHDLNRLEERWLRHTEAGFPVFRIPRPTRFCAFRADEDLDLSRMTMTVDDYTRRGRMFDGRPIFVAERFDVLEVGMDHFVSEEEWGLSRMSYEGIFNTLRNEAFHYAQSTYPNLREIDRKTEVDLYQSAGMQARGFRVRLIVAVKKVKHETT